MEEIVETDQERNYYYDLRSKDIQTDNLLRGVEESVVKLYKRFIHKRIQSLDVEQANAQSLPLQEQFNLLKERTQNRIAHYRIHPRFTCHPNFKPAHHANQNYR